MNFTYLFLSLPCFLYVNMNYCQPQLFFKNQLCKHVPDHADHEWKRDAQILYSQRFLRLEFSPSRTSASGTWFVDRLSFLKSHYWVSALCVILAQFLPFVDENTWRSLVENWPLFRLGEEELSVGGQKVDIIGYIDIRLSAHVWKYWWICAFQCR